MTRVVISVIGDTPDELAERARAASKLADLVEIRLDGPSGLPWDLRVYFEGISKPTIATVRTAEEGGRSHADDATRGDILLRALRAGADYIDIESWHDDAPRLVRAAHDLGRKAIVSIHDLTGTPGLDVMLTDARNARAMGADVVKFATTVETRDDAVTLVEAAVTLRREGIPAALMAVNDPFLRLLAPTLGLALAYASLPDAPVTAPGQVPAPVLRDVHEDLARFTRGPQRGATRPVFLLGRPVAHSRSPAMQNAAFAAARIDACYQAVDIGEAGLPAFLQGLRHTNALGANVTIPHKIDAARLVDEVAPTARRAGAVNTIVVKEGRLVGHNTDGEGAVDALLEKGATLQGARTLVLGAGGAARGVLAALVDAGATVTIANRTLANAETLAREIGGAAVVAWDAIPEHVAQADIVANATSIGLLDTRAPIDVRALPEKAVVLDCVYREGGTTLLRDARSHGIRAVGGQSMLLHQGARAFALWTGEAAPLDVMRAALEESL